ILSFAVLDNEGVSKVNIYINNSLITEITEEGTLETNIDTSILSDGENTLKIEAIDLAENKAIFEVNFISYNTGPEINFTSISNDMIIDESLILSPAFEDEHSEIASVEIKFNDESLLSSEVSSEINYEFDPEIFEAG